MPKLLTKKVLLAIVWPRQTDFELDKGSLDMDMVVAFILVKPEREKNTTYY